MFEVSKEKFLQSIKLAEGAEVSDKVDSTGCEFKVVFFKSE
jgi:hypothetical protein